MTMTMMTMVVMLMTVMMMMVAPIIVPHYIILRESYREVYLVIRDYLINLGKPLSAEYAMVDFESNLR